jgi:hypothetical protein
MSGYNLVLTIRRIEEECDKLGMMLCHSKHHYSKEFGDVVAVKPKDNDSLPIYSRDAELFVGTLHDLGKWIEGIKWARQYDQLVFKKEHNKKREQKEQEFRNQSLVNILKQDEKHD